MSAPSPRLRACPPARTPRASIHPRVAAAAAILLAVTLTTHCIGDGYREDELECERAAAHVADCCPGARHLESGCNHIEGSSSDVGPFLTTEQGRCLQGTSCAELAADGVCAVLAPNQPSEGAAGAPGPSSPAPRYDDTVEPPARKALREDFARRSVCK